MLSVVESHMESDNELRLTYAIESSSSKPYQITIALVFEPNSWILARADITGLDDQGVDCGDIVDSMVHANNPRGLVSAILTRARQGANA